MEVNGQMTCSAGYSHIWISQRTCHPNISIGKKNWMFHDSIMGEQASAFIYSISETAKLNNLSPYYYFKHLLVELPRFCDEKGNIDSAKLEHLLPWAKLPAECRKLRR